MHKKSLKETQEGPCIKSKTPTTYQIIVRMKLVNTIREGNRMNMIFFKHSTHKQKSTGTRVYH